MNIHKLKLINDLSIQRNYVKNYSFSTIVGAAQSYKTAKISIANITYSGLL